jgi:hypothetical protein
MNFSAKVQKVMDSEHISPTEMQEMLSKAAITSLLGYSRRYHHWLFKFEGDTVTDMVGDEVSIVGRGGLRMQEDCEACGSKGCKECNWHGFIYRRCIDHDVKAFSYSS